MKADGALRPATEYVAWLNRGPAFLRDDRVSRAMPLSLSD